LAAATPQTFSFLTSYDHPNLPSTHHLLLFWVQQIFNIYKLLPGGKIANKKVMN